MGEGVTTKRLSEAFCLRGGFDRPLVEYKQLFKVRESSRIS